MQEVRKMGFKEALKYVKKTLTNPTKIQLRDIALYYGLNNKDRSLLYEVIL